MFYVNVFTYNSDEILYYAHTADDGLVSSHVNALSEASYIVRDDHNSLELDDVDARLTMLAKCWKVCL